MTGVEAADLALGAVTLAAALFVFWRLGLQDEAAAAREKRERERQARLLEKLDEVLAAVRRLR